MPSLRAKCGKAHLDAPQIVECCTWDRTPPRFLIHDRNGRYGVSFDRCVRHFGVQQVRPDCLEPMPSLKDG
jgi:hypothetical protein